MSINTLDSHMNQINMNNNPNYLDNNNMNQLYNKYPTIQLPNGDKY